MWPTQYDPQNMTHTMRHTQYQPYNMTHTKWPTQCDPHNVSHTMWPIDCDSNNVTHTVWGRWPNTEWHTYLKTRFKTYWFSISGEEKDPRKKVQFKDESDEEESNHEVQKGANSQGKWAFIRALQHDMPTDFNSMK